MKTFFKSLAAAAAGGAVTGVAHGYATGVVDPKATGVVAIAGALVGVVGYLMKSPLGAQVVAAAFAQAGQK